MTALASLLRKKMSVKKLSASQASRAVGISYPTFQGALTGSRVPNARCIPKYAKFLGISREAVLEAAGPKAARRLHASTSKSGRLPKAGRAGGAASARATRKLEAVIARIKRALEKAATQLATLAGGVVSPARTPRIARAPKAKMAAKGRPRGRREPHRFGSKKHRGKSSHAIIPQKVKARFGASLPPRRGAARDAAQPIKPPVPKPVRKSRPAAPAPVKPAADVQPTTPSP